VPSFVKNGGILFFRKIICYITCGFSAAALILMKRAKIALFCGNQHVI
jgi:hypothetical protein